ncbi:uncharacterized protein LOC128952542 [Oppia nitens]|uniref:uncharacterized protein LOC128952542 n=1 Tax=Oppia nitens TaxID=1686743 RepID=UPI0023DC7B95|nr:uncharacterized protein LOC128952542 [Oppia nitens]
MLLDLSHQKPNNNYSLPNNLILRSKPINFYSRNLALNLPVRQKLEFDKFQNMTLKSIRTVDGTLFNKTYKTKEEEEERVGLFKETIVSINKHNADDCSHYIQGINEMSDMEDCGSCWCFASASVLESHLMKVQISEDKFDPSNQLILSQQNLLDCTRSYGTDGCNGGSSRDVFEFLKSVKEINTYSTYPYTGIPGDCKFHQESPIFVDIKEVNHITTGADDELAYAIYTHGPVTVSFHITHGFKDYKYGIFEDPLCDPNSVSHYLTAVGYTPDCTTSSIRDIRIVENSSTNPID